jgi:hypothetical protein
VFAWRFLDGNGEEIGSSDRFPDREAAEAWMGEAWADLRDRGVEAVVLIDQQGDRPLYRMGLDPGAEAG